MRESLDALRSVAKYAWWALGDEWEVRLAFEEGTFTRPFCRVGYGSPESSGGAAHTIDVQRAFNILCHPAETTTADQAVLEAGRVAALLRQAVEVGVRRDEGSPPVTVIGGAWRIPLWDWAGVTLDQDSTARIAHDYLRVSDFSVNELADPNDEARRAVACDLRLSWRRHGRRYTGQPLERVKVAFTEP